MSGFSPDLSGLAGYTPSASASSAASKAHLLGREDNISGKLCYGVSTVGGNNIFCTNYDGTYPMDNNTSLSLDGWIEVQ